MQHLDEMTAGSLLYSLYEALQGDKWEKTKSQKMLTIFLDI